MNNELDRVHQQLTISNISAARTEPMYDYDAVITVCQDSIEDHIPEEVEYHFFEMADGPDCRYGGRHDYQYFEYAARTILRHLEEGDTLLVHCHRGRSRSVSTSIAALSVYEETSYEDMQWTVKSRRPHINPDSLLADHAKKFIKQYGNA